jgi:metal-sulfur cluster biosynthetic enzyme
MGMKKIISIRKDEPEGAGDKGVSFKKFDKEDKQEKSGVELTQEEVYNSLREVYDPEIPVSIVDLGLIYDVIISSGSNVNIKMTLTTPGCGMGAMIAQQAEAAVIEAGADNVLVEVVWDPPWNPDMMSEEAKQKLGIT